jgi:hypothetical protein
MADDVAAVVADNAAAALAEPEGGLERLGRP